jgi:hypothetical protein
MFCGACHMPGCMCCQCRTVRRGYVIPHRKVREKQVNDVVMFVEHSTVKKPDTKMNGMKPEPLLEDSAFTAELPALSEHLIQTQYDDGTHRQTSTLLIFVDGGVLKLCLSDREVGRSCFVSAATFEEALKKLDQQLADDTADWRVKRQSFASNQRPTF